MKVGEPEQQQYGISYSVLLPPHKDPLETLETRLLFIPFITVPPSPLCKNARQAAYLVSELMNIFPPEVSCSHH